MKLIKSFYIAHPSSLRAAVSYYGLSVGAVGNVKGFFILFYGNKRLD